MGAESNQDVVCGDVNADVERLVAEAAVRDVHSRYCRGIDRMDWDLVRSCYHPDAVDNHGPYKGDVEGFIGWVSGLLPAYESTTHFVGQQLVEVDGDVAWHEAYCRAYHRSKATDDAPASDSILNIRYVDRMERRGGQWRIAARVVVVDSARTDPVAGDPDVGSEWVQGSRDRTDPSYDRTAA
jgi:hypothetical protein